MILEYSRTALGIEKQYLEEPCILKRHYAIRINVHLADATVTVIEV